MQGEEAPVELVAGRLRLHGTVGRPPLLEQATRDIVRAAFQSAGQRCSALRMLYVQEDIAPKLMEMLEGAMDVLVVGDPWDLATDAAPVIDQGAWEAI